MRRHASRAFELVALLLFPAVALGFLLLVLQPPPVLARALVVALQDTPLWGLLYLAGVCILPVVLGLLWLVKARLNSHDDRLLAGAAPWENRHR